MKLENTLDLITKNSLNESISIENVESFVGTLVKEGMVKSSTKDLCYTAPLNTPSGFVFSAEKIDNKIKINRNFVQAQDHIILTELTKEVIDDIYKQFGENAPELLSDLIQRDIFIDQDKELFRFIDNIAIEDNIMDLRKDGFDAATVRLQGLMDQQLLVISEKVKANMGAVIIGSPRVIGLLIMNDNDVEKKDDLQYSYAGSVGTRDLFVDYNATEDYLTVGLNGDHTLRGVVFCPYNISTSYYTAYSTGSEVVRINNRYVFTRNPLDEQTGEKNSKFFIKTKIIFDDATFNPDITEFTTAFEAEINN